MFHTNFTLVIHGRLIVKSFWSIANAPVICLIYGWYAIDQKAFLCSQDMVIASESTYIAECYLILNAVTLIMANMH